MKKPYVLFILFICLFVWLKITAQTITDPSKERIVSFDITHGYKLVPDSPTVPLAVAVSFNHAWTKTNNPICNNFNVSPKIQNPLTFDYFGSDKITNNLVFNSYSTTVAAKDTFALGAGTFANNTSSICVSKSNTQTIIKVDPLASNSPVKGSIRTVGFSQGIIDPPTKAEAYAFCMGGVSLIEGRDLLKGQIGWDPKIISNLLGKVKGIRQKGGTNDPIVYYVRDSTGLSLDSGTLFSVKILFSSGEDTVDLVNSWENDTVHIESDTAEFSIEFPSVYTSVKGFAHLKIEGGIVTLSDDSGFFDGVLPPVGEDTINFFLDDSLSFHYNLDTLVPHYTNDSLYVRIFMYGNCENNYVKILDTITFGTHVIAVPLCAGGSNASISISVTDGISPFAFLWSNGSTTKNISGLTAGTYTVTVTDALGVSASAVYVVTQPAAISTIFSTSNVTCSGGNNGSLNVAASGGTSPYSYTWNNGSTNVSISGLTAGTYTVTVTDANGCTVSSVSAVTEPTAITTSFSTTNVTCIGGNNGSISVTASGGIPPFSYIWNNGGTNTFVSGLTAGTYTVTVTDANGCTVSSVSAVTEPTSITTSFSTTNVTCIGSNNGSISVTVSGGTPPYSYFWNNGSINASISGLNTGTYTVTVIDAHGCTKTSSTTLIALNSIPAQPANIGGPTAVCKNSYVNYIIPLVPGATSYTWTATSGASVFSGQGSPSPVIYFSNTATNASLTVVANNVCGSGVARTLSYTVSSVMPAQPSGINGPLYGLCNLNSVAYNCPIVPNAISYLWSVPAGVNILTGQGTNSITVKFTSAFTNTGSLSVVAQNGCGSSTACIRTLNAKPAQPIISGQNWACKNQPGLVYSVAPVTGATSYTWTVVPGSTLVSGQGTPSIVVNWGPVNGVIKCTANNACGSSIQASLPVSFTCKEAGDLFDFSELSLFPNPASTSVTLQFDGFAEGKGQLMVFDLVGQEVLSKTLNVSAGDNRFLLDVVSFPKGIYSIRVIYNDMTRYEKLIVQ